MVAAVAAGTVAVLAAAQVSVAWEGGGEPVVESGPPVVSQTSVAAPDGSTGDRFGRAVDIWGDTMVVGAPKDTHSGKKKAGSAHVFVRDGDQWVFEGRLVAADPENWALFGAAVAVWDDTIAVGAPHDDIDGVANAGSVYLFVRDGEAWVQRQKLRNPGPDPYEGYAFAVALWEDRLVVGVPDEGEGTCHGGGAAYVYDRSGTTFRYQKKLVAPNTEMYDWFGYSVAVWGSQVFVGAPGRGAVFVYSDASGHWQRETKLTAPLPHQEYFGTGVAVFRGMLSEPASLTPTTRLVVASNALGDSQHRAFVFDRTRIGLTTSWDAGSTLILPTPDTQASAIAPEIGYRCPLVWGPDDVTVDVYGDTVVAGIDGNGAWGYVLFKGIWWPRATFTPHDGEASDSGFGRSVAIWGDQVAVGAVESDRVFPFEKALCRNLWATHVGTDGDDDIDGTAGRDVVVAKRGHDTIDVFGGDDVVCAGPGQDTVHGGPGKDRIYGEGGNDILFGDGQRDTLNGGWGIDRLYGGGGADTLRGAAGDDLLFGQSGDDTLLGDAGDDYGGGGIGTDKCRVEKKAACEL